MPTKKKVIPKPVESKPRYQNGNKVFICNYANAGAGQILEGEIKRIVGTSDPVVNENGKIIGSDTKFTYFVKTVKGEFEFAQYNVYPNFQAAAAAFSKGFVYLLK